VLWLKLVWFLLPTEHCEQKVTLCYHFATQPNGTSRYEEQPVNGGGASLPVSSVHYEI
jgi:hypothetical protein